MQLLDVTVYYLEMTAPSGRVVPPPCAGLAVRHVPAPSVAFYRALYDAVGRDYHWLSRRKLSDENLAAILNDPLVEMHVLSVDGSDAGFVEFDRRTPGEVEIVQFGLSGPYHGRGLGKWFLRWAIERAWSYAPRRLWLHTCTLDHPAAVPNYLKAGFREFKQERIRRVP
jgi:GNAT superfamily N-acetyltransferase